MGAKKLNYSVCIDAVFRCNLTEYLTKRTF